MMADPRGPSKPEPLRGWRRTCAARAATISMDAIPSLDRLQGMRNRASATSGRDEEMTLFPRFGRATALCMAVVMLIVSLPLGVAKAKLVTTADVIGAPSAAGERERITAFLRRTEVQAQMSEWGVDATEAAVRVAALSDDEVRRIAGRVDNLPSGQAAGTIALVALSALVFVVLLQALGTIDIFGSATSPSEPGSGRE